MYSIKPSIPVSTFVAMVSSKSQKTLFYDFHLKMGSCCNSKVRDEDKAPKGDPHEKESMLTEGNGTTTHSYHIVPDSDDEPHKVIHSDSHKHPHKRYKIIFLGAGMSGKTTLFKQMRTLHGHRFTKNDFMNCKPYLTANLIEAFRKLCIYSDILMEQDYCCLHTSVSDANRLMRDQVARLNDRAIFDHHLLEVFHRLLEDEGIQNTLQFRYQFQLSDNFDYLVQHMDEYCKPDYIPSYQDFLHVKHRTIGIQKMSFKLLSKNDKGATEYYDLHDAGGQRTERKKWMMVVRSATAYIFVCAISGYNQSLWEEPSYNRMREAFHLFRRIYHMEALSKAHCVLFLNKYDLFKEKIGEHSIKEAFPEYQGKETPELVAAFIVNKFREQQDPKYKLDNGSSRGTTPHSHAVPDRAIYFHFTCATDTNCVNKVFELCRDIIVLNRLANIGFV
eukprot:436452_1